MSRTWADVLTRPREVGYDGREEEPVSRFRCRMCGCIHAEATEGGFLADVLKLSLADLAATSAEISAFTRIEHA